MTEPNHYYHRKPIYIISPIQWYHSFWVKMSSVGFIHGELRKCCLWSGSDHVAT